MPAAKIMLIRHAEKPEGDGGPGLMPNGAENPRALTLAGWKRANALVGLFNPPDGVSPRPPLAKPMSLFASGSESLRPKQTVAPLAAALNLSIRTFLKGQEVELVAAVKKSEDPVLISWQHEAIPDIAALIRGDVGGVPPKLAGSRLRPRLGVRPSAIRRLEFYADSRTRHAGQLRETDRPRRVGLRLRPTVKLKHGRRASESSGRRRSDWDPA